MGRRGSRPEAGSQKTLLSCPAVAPSKVEGRRRITLIAGTTRIVLHSFAGKENEAETDRKAFRLLSRSLKVFLFYVVIPQTSAGDPAGKEYLK